MKNFHGTAIVFLAVISAEAQITLTQSDMPQIGNVYITESDTVPTVSPGQAGPNQTWDLSAIKSLTAETTFCVTPSSTPYSASFPNSNLAVRFRTALDSTFEYSNSSSGSLVSLGDIVLEPAGTFMAALSPGITTVLLPCTYLSNWSDSPTDAATTSLGAERLKEVTHLSISNTVDGWGTVITPAGSFSSLRVKQIQTTMSDSIFAYSTGTGTWAFITSKTGTLTGESFLWYAASKGQPLASLDLDSLGGHTRIARYLASANSAITEPSHEPTFSTYTRPAIKENLVTVESQPGSTIRILTMQGRLLKSLAAAGDRTIVNISLFPSGVYFFEVNKETQTVVKR
jgi:hypothetical protein